MVPLWGIFLDPAEKIWISQLKKKRFLFYSITNTEFYALKQCIEEEMKK